MSRWQYRKGLLDVGNGCYAYLQPDGSWGWSNAGLVVDSGQSLLVDTLFDIKLTGEMLAAMRRAEPKAAARIDAVVNTHSNGDHYFGNELVADAEIIASKACDEEMRRDEAANLRAKLMRDATQLGDAGKFIAEIFAPFNFEGLKPALPTRTFETELTWEVGNKTVRMINVGPAHTGGDVIVHLPDDRIVYTGDILFIGGHPLIWAGPVGNWIKACDLIMAMDVEVIVPGHGPITEKRGVAAVKSYLDYIATEARKRYDAGMSAFEAAMDIPLTRFSSWTDGERIVANVVALYREFSNSVNRPTIVELFDMMAKIRKNRRARG
jgi:cyclase